MGNTLFGRMNPTDREDEKPAEPGQELLGTQSQNTADYHSIPTAGLDPPSQPPFQSVVPPTQLVQPVPPVQSDPLHSPQPTYNGLPFAPHITSHTPTPISRPSFMAEPLSTAQVAAAVAAAAATITAAATFDSQHLFRLVQIPKTWRHRQLGHQFQLEPDSTTI